MAILSLVAACGPTPAPEVVEKVVKETVVVEKEVEVTKVVEKEVQITPTPMPTGPRQGGTLMVAFNADVSFNPVVARGPNVSYIQETMFNGLVRPDRETNEPIPDLAESWETSEDGLTWTFHLRKDVKWHDGQPFTAADVKFTYDEGVFNEEVNSRIRPTLVKVLKAVEVVDDYTVRFVLLEPYAPLPTVLADCQLIVPKHILEGKDLNTYDEFNKTNPIGTGPFKLEEAVTGDHYTVVANEDYFGGRPYLDSIVFKVVPDPNVRMAQLKTGEIELNIISPANLAAMAAEHNILIDYMDKLQFYGIYLNSARSPFDDARVRRAMIYALDREAINDAISGGTWTIATGPIHPSTRWAYPPDVPVIPYDPDKAKELLAEAGWTDSDGDGILDKDGQPFKFTMTVDVEPMRNQTAVIAQQYYQELGMDVELEVLEWGTLVKERYFANNYDALVIYQVYMPDPAGPVEIFLTGSTNNRWNYSNTEVDELVPEGRRAADKEKRQKIYYRLQEILAIEDPPLVFLFYPKEIRAYAKDLKNLPLGLDYFYSWRYAHEWWLDS
jgi:peptide/nickel transport system substrate-binding protein